MWKWIVQLFNKLLDFEDFLRCDTLILIRINTIFYSLFKELTTQSDFIVKICGMITDKIRHVCAERYID